MLLQKHNELVFEVPSSQINALSTLVVAEMTAVGHCAFRERLTPNRGRIGPSAKRALSVLIAIHFT